MTIYVLICPELYEREGTPYGANNGRDWPDNLKPWSIIEKRLDLAAEADLALAFYNPISRSRPSMGWPTKWNGVKAPGTG